MNPVFLPRPSAIVHAMRMAGLIAGLSLAAGAAHADEMTDMKAMIKQLQQRIDQMETKAAAAPAAPAVAAPVAGTAAAAKAPTGFVYKLYGRGDVGYTESTGTDATGRVITTKRLNQGEMASRLGLTGAWVFNDDYKAIFGVESGLNLFNGNAGGGTQNNTTSPVLFNRGATAGFATRQYGSIEGGTMYMAPFWVALGADLASAHNYGANDFSALFSVTRPESLGRYLKDPVAVNVSKTVSLAGNNSGTALFYGNALRYRTPAMGPFSGEISYSNGQQASGATPLRQDGHTWAANVLYSKDNLFLGYAHMDYMQVNDTATTGTANFVTRNQVTDVLGARYKWNDLTLGTAYTAYRVSNSGGYHANAFGFSGAYDIGKHRVEASAARVTYGGANATGAFGTNTGNGRGEPVSTSLGLGYIYSLENNLSFYTYYNKIINNGNAKLGVLQFRGDNNSFGYNPAEITAGMFFVF